jgi:hypothetical protein
MTKVVDAKGRKIDYYLNIIGIRVWEHSCRLIAKNPRAKNGWTVIGAPRELPLSVPRNVEGLKETDRGPLVMTAFQYRAEFPDSDLPEVLGRRKKFEEALKKNGGVKSGAR